MALCAALPVQAQTPRPQRSLGGAQCSKTSGYDAIVVGAGLSGLAAAKELRHLGRSVLILEANDRIGGRAFVGHIAVGDPSDPQAPIDYGGAWIHGVATNPLTSMVDAMGFRRSRSELDAPYYTGSARADDRQQKLFHDGLDQFEEALERATAAEEHEHAVAQYACHAATRIEHHETQAAELCTELSRSIADRGVADRLCGRARRIGVDVTAKAFCEEAHTAIRTTPDAASDYLPKDPRFRNVLPLIRANAGPLETSSELRDSSAVDAAQFAAGEDDLINKGMGAFVEKFGEDLPVCLNSPVTEVRYSESGVEVAAAGRRYAGSHAVVTASVGVLRAKRIAFRPALPAWKQRAIDRLPMGSLQKIIIPFTRDIFPAELPNSWVLYQGSYLDDELKLAKAKGIPQEDPQRRVMAFVVKPLGTNLAIGFFGGKWAEAFEGECKGKERTSGRRSASGCDDLPIRVATNALSAMYGEAAVAGAIQREGIHVTRWSLDETSLGAYSAPLPGNWDQHEVLRRPIGAGPDGEGPRRLFFAGEGAARAIYNGSYPGAYESGIEAAREIHALMLEASRK